MTKQEFKNELEQAITQHGYWSKEVKSINEKGQKELGYNVWLRMHDKVRAKIRAEYTLKN